MKTNPVSFKSLLVFTINDGKPHAPIPDIVRAAFKNNPALKQYDFDTYVRTHDEEIDGTVYNANSDFCQLLDARYRNVLTKGSKRIIMTTADFLINPTDTQKRHFITAATADDEEKILKELGKSNHFYTARFKRKKN